MIQFVKIDDDIDERLKEFNATIPDGYKIKSIVPNESYLFITLEKKEDKGKNLLLEHFISLDKKKGP